MVEFIPHDHDRPSVDPLAPPRFQAFDWEHAYLSGPAAEFSRAFGVLSRSQAHGRNGEHRAKLKVNFAPDTAFVVPIKIEQGLSVGRAAASGEAQTPPEAQDAPTGTQEGFPHD